MERLTFEGNFCDIAQCRELPCPYNGSCSQRKAWERLKAYEDTWLEPESVEALKLSMMGKTIAEIKEFSGLPVDRLRKLAEADEDGRVVVLPCKVGADIYRVGAKGVCGYWQIERAEIYQDEIVLVDDSDNVIFLDDLGKTVFLTREEAEKVLKTMEGE